MHKANDREGEMSIGKKLISAFFMMLLSFIFAGVLGMSLILMLSLGEEALVLIFFPPVAAGFVSLFMSWKLLFLDEPTFNFIDEFGRLIFKGVMVSALIGVGLGFLFFLFLGWR